MSTGASPLRKSIARGPQQVASDAAHGADRAGADQAPRASTYWAYQRRVWLIEQRHAGRPRQAAIMRSASARVVAIGFSQKMPFTPASTASTTIWAWRWSEVTTLSRSSRSLRQHLPVVGVHRRVGPDAAPSLAERVEHCRRDIADGDDVGLRRQAA